MNENELFNHILLKHKKLGKKHDDFSSYNFSKLQNKKNEFSKQKSRVSKKLSILRKK